MTERKRLFVSNRNESPKMFQNPVLDFFTRTPFYTVPLLFVPISGYFMYRAAVQHGVDWYWCIALFFGGYMVWTLMEYLIHRYVFHLKFTSELGKKFHHIAHGIHHDFPNDALRLVMPPSINLTLAFIFYWIFYAIIRDVAITAAFFSGFTFGYMVYDMVHFSTHFANFKMDWFQRIKRSHLMHHYNNPNSGFGLSTVFWDRVFRTMHPPEVQKRVDREG